MKDQGKNTNEKMRKDLVGIRISELDAIVLGRRDSTPRQGGEGRHI